MCAHTLVRFFDLEWKLVSRAVVEVSVLRYRVRVVTDMPARDTHTPSHTHRHRHRHTSLIATMAAFRSRSCSCTRLYLYFSTGEINLSCYRAAPVLLHGNYLAVL